MDELTFNYQPDLDGREPLDPKTIADGTPVLIVNNDDERNWIYSLAVFRRKYDNAAECHLCFYAPDKHNVYAAYYALHYRDRSLHPDNKTSRENKACVTIGSSCLGIEGLHCLSFYSMNNHDITVLGSVLNSARLAWDMETRQLIDCDTHEVLSAAERPPQPTAPKPKYNPIITREALLAMTSPPLDWIIEKSYMFLFVDGDPESKHYIVFDFGENNSSTAFSVSLYSEDISIDIEDPDRITWSNLLLAIAICYDINKQGSPIHNLVRQFPTTITITETQKQ